MDKNPRRIISALCDHCDDFTKTAEKQVGLISGLHQDLVEVASNEHEMTRSVILEAVNRKGSASTSDGKTRRPSRNEEWANREDEELHAKEVAEDRILQGLLFPSITARYSQVAKTHAKNFEWIFKRPQEDDQSWSSFEEWLPCGKGIYWINGKVGPGKSTLMR
jgi:predicted ATPase